MRQTKINGYPQVNHVEFGHFYNPAHFDLFEKYAVRNSDSLGMNEVEVTALLQKWSKNLGLEGVADRAPQNLDDVLVDTEMLFELAKK